ncbi:N-acetyltransferase [Herbiconiux sp. 11R-BC]|uniref:GNAT family N-acetyltransferase n=1 Tax=Herbiconiux sp. 11R-BC TaxID=3111637 RepID=UPI003C009A32
MPERRREPGLRVRPFDPAREADRAAILDICLRTGDAGGDASALHPDPRELTDRYATPYLDEAPEWCFVAESADAGTAARVVGYILGVPDTAAFAAATGLRLPAVAGHPAHLHVDLLPEAQGQGGGRMLMDALLARLTAAGIPGVHLVVDPRNTGALAFYPRLGFTELARTPTGVIFARPLPHPQPPS